MHALMVLLAFTLAALVTYVVVLGALTLLDRRWHADDPVVDVPDDPADLDARPTRSPRVHC